MIYVHIPFCRSFCTYCDFYSEVASRCSRDEKEKFARFSQALSAEAAMRSEEISDQVNTLYIGGGTPSVLPLSVFEDLLRTFRECGKNCSFEEFTVEVNPEDVVEKGTGYVEGLLRLGVNRISMGVQSFDDEILRWMNRRHDSDTARRAYHILEEAGVPNISIDLIFGLSQLSDSRWNETMDKALNISSKGRLPHHISSYQLSVEPGSALARLVDRGEWEEASEDLCARQYAMLCGRLREAGYHHYEISNFAQPGYEAVHNSAYWSHVPYVGLGPGAHSFLPDTSRQCVPMAPSQQSWAPPQPATAGFSLQKSTGLFAFRSRGCENAISTHLSSMHVGTRQWNEGDLGLYLNAGENGDFSVVQGREELTEEQLVLEHVMLGLRTSAGLPEAYLRANCDRQALEQALACGHLVRQADGTMRIPESYFFISDSIITSLV